MPIYEYENKRTGERFTENLPIDKRNFPCRNINIRRVVTAPNLTIISAMGGKEDKAREQMMQVAEKGYQQREEKKIETPTWAKERREKSKQKRRWF